MGLKLSRVFMQRERAVRAEEAQVANSLAGGMFVLGAELEVAAILCGGEGVYLPIPQDVHSFGRVKSLGSRGTLRLRPELEKKGDLVSRPWLTEMKRKRETKNGAEPAAAGKAARRSDTAVRRIRQATKRDKRRHCKSRSRKKLGPIPHDREKATINRGESFRCTAVGVQATLSTTGSY